MEIQNILTSSVSDIAKKILLKIGNFLGSLGESEASATDAQSWGTSGFLSRPRDADNDGCAEALTIRQGNTIHAIGTRDLRDAIALGNVNAGDSIQYAIVDKEAFCGFICKSATGQAMVYSPCDIENGVPSTAHVIALDPDTKAITICNSSGFAVILKEDAITLCASNGTQLINIGNDGIQICGTISLIGSVNVAGNLTSTHIAGASILAGAVDPQGGVMAGPIILS